MQMTQKDTNYQSPSNRFGSTLHTVSGYHKFPAEQNKTETVPQKLDFSRQPGQEQNQQAINAAAK